MSCEALQAGLLAEDRVVNELFAASWPIVRTGNQLDYAQKIDVQAVCPGRSAFNLQVSLTDKSTGEQARLAARHVIPLSLAAVEKSGLTTPAYICQNYVY